MLSLCVRKAGFTNRYATTETRFQQDSSSDEMTEIACSNSLLVKPLLMQTSRMNSSEDSKFMYIAKLVFQGLSFRLEIVNR
uniref:Uncharacterized protein n=1 Tax=Candidatus Kentrum sp. FW TaxID=2126338 RepID=A0A450RTH0_9GAMM|nr:MAG: hypothetical protein BECKFW1821A_GA0114235_100188 [Candidatus Kentron sp. FW]